MNNRPYICTIIKIKRMKIVFVFKHILITIHPIHIQLISILTMIETSPKTTPAPTP